MAKIETTYLRRFLDPVNLAGEEYRKALKELDGVGELEAKKRVKVLKAISLAEDVYNSAVGELIGGLNKLLEDAEAELPES
jgi:hypothetical protein